MNEAPQKQPMDWDTLSGLARIANDIHAMKEGGQKELLKGKFEKVHAKLLEKYDMPVQPIAPDQFGLKLLDYGSGIARTTAGELARAGKASVDTVRGQPSSWTPGSAGNAFLSALNPLNGQPAKSSSAYMEDVGVPAGYSVADIPGAQRIGIEHGGPLDFTSRGVGGFALDMGLTPRNFNDAVGKIKGVKPEVPMVDRPLPQQMELPIDGDIPRSRPQSAKLLRTVDELTHEAQDSAGAQPFFTMQNGKDFLSGLGQLVKDPADVIAHKLHNFRFRHADEAAAMRGKVLPSDVMWEARKTQGAGGFTPEGIRADMQKVITGHENTIDQLAQDARDSGTLPTAKRGTVTNAPEGTALHGLLGPDQMAAEREMVGGAAARSAREGVLNDVRSVESGRELRPAHEQDFTQYDPLNHDRGVDWEEMNRIRQQAQAEAKARNWYSSRKDMLQAPLPGDAKKIAEEAATYSRWGHAAGNAADDMLDASQEGAGAAAYLRRKDMAALLEGGGWLDRSPVRGATTRSQIAFAPIEGRLINLGERQLNNAAMGASQVLSNPWARYAALPAARAGWLNYDEQKRNTPTVDAMGLPSGPNPWAEIYRYGAQQ